MINPIKFLFRKMVRREVDLYLKGTIPKEVEKTPYRPTTDEENENYLKDMVDK